MSKMKVYISGSITGLDEEYVKSLFEFAENWWKELGHEPVNPMKIEHNHDCSWESYMKEDLKALLDCDHIFMLDNWWLSRGARIEHDLAKELGIKIIYNTKNGVYYHVGKPLF